MGERTCSIEGCAGIHYIRGWCQRHHQRWKRTGDPCGTRRLPIAERFWTKVNASGVCWEWTGCVGENGYGQTRTQGQGRGFAHRVAWELLVGPIPDGLVIDHLCRNRRCVNPDHLEPVTNIENIRRGYAGHNQPYILKTHCKRGHEFTPDNTYVTPSTGGRQCLACKALHKRGRQLLEVAP